MPTIADYRDAFADDHVFVISEAAPRITLAVQAKGGSSHPDKAYAHNDFFYELRLDGVVIDEGDDIRSTATPMSSRQAAVMYADGITDSTGEFEGWVSDEMRAAVSPHWLLIKWWVLDQADDSDDE